MRTLYRNPDGTIPRDAGGVLMCCCSEIPCCPDANNLEAVIASIDTCPGCIYVGSVGPTSYVQMTVISGALNGLVTAIPSVGVKHWQKTLAMTVQFDAYDPYCDPAFLLDSTSGSPVIDITCDAGVYNARVYVDLVFGTHTEFNGRYTFFYTDFGASTPAVLVNALNSFIACGLDLGPPSIAFGYNGTITVDCVPP